MNVREQVPLASLTTLGVGGNARFFIETHSREDIQEALAFAHARSLPLFVLGSGSNVLVTDDGFNGLVLKVAGSDIAVEEEGDTLWMSAAAGVSWDAVVDTALSHGIYGIENLAGIPGSLGGAAVQNIGAYGAEFSSVFNGAEVIDATSGVQSHVALDDAAFAYRDSFFKQHPNIIITRVSLRLSRSARPNLAYADLARAQAVGQPLSTPEEIARAIRAIRAEKFPPASLGGSAGSFFKNPIISAGEAAVLEGRFPGLPTFPQEHGLVKVPLAWILDHVLGLKGHTIGRARLYERQPLVIVADSGATAADVDALARDVAQRVFEAIGIRIEREVETFSEKIFP